MSKETKNQESFNLPFELVRWENKKAEIQNQKGVVSKELTFLENLQGEEINISNPIQEKIKKGEVSTKDKIKDFSIVYFGDSEERKAQLYNLENQLKEHKGEFVLLKAIEHRAHGHIDFEIDPKPHPELYHWEEIASVGIISKKTPLDLDVKKGEIIIAQEKYSSINIDDWRNLKPFPQNEPLFFRWYETAQLDESVESFYANSRPFFPSEIYPTVEKINSRGKKDLIMEIIIGDKDVFNYFKTRSLLDLYPLVAKQLGRELKSLPPESEKALLERKRKIFSNLQEAVEKERNLRKKLEGIKNIKAPKAGDGIHFADIDRNTEDEIEDLKIIKSIPLNNEHKEILGKIERYIGEALDFGIHKTPWIIKKDLEPGKVEINVPQTVMNYCEYYDFPEIKKKLV